VRAVLLGGSHRQHRDGVGRLATGEQAGPDHLHLADLGGGAYDLSLV